VDQLAGRSQTLQMEDKNGGIKRLREKPNVYHMLWKRREAFVPPQGQYYFFPFIVVLNLLCTRVSGGWRKLEGCHPFTLLYSFRPLMSLAIPPHLALFTFFRLPVQFCLPESAIGDFLGMYIKRQHNLLVKSVGWCQRPGGCYGYLVINMDNN
jgi:hypothetical protein